jgi:hypothetical protein
VPTMLRPYPSPPIGGISTLARIRSEISVHIRGWLKSAADQSDS